MAKYVTKVRTQDGDLQIDYNALANLPKSDTTLSESGKFADSKTVGDRITSAVNDLKSQVSNITPESISAINTNKIANNVTTQEDGYVLDAKQGVHLQGEIDGLASRVQTAENNITNCNNNISANASAISANTTAIAGKVSMQTATATLSSSSWSNKQQTVSVSGVTASNVIISTPAPNSYVMYNECGVRCSAQSAGNLTFTCTDVPSASLTANILILN